MVYLILPSGTQASYKASEIDIEKTEKVNVIDYGGTTKLIEGRGKPKQLPKGVRFEEEPSFGQYISGRTLVRPEGRARRGAWRDGGLGVCRGGSSARVALGRAQ